MIYLDNAATTAVYPECAAAVHDILQNTFGNPSSLYTLGIEAENEMTAARKTVAKALGCLPEELYFTGCGTESNNLAILGAARARKNWGNEVVVTGYEHPSVQNTVDALEDEGFVIQTIWPSKQGVISAEEMLAAVGPKTVLVAAMSVNNETGAVLDVAHIAKKVKEINKRTAFHCDHIQGFLKYPLALGHIDTLALTGHKIHAPKGIGALYIRKGFHINNVYFGGGQENGVRSGTENIAYMKAFAVAIEKMRQDAGQLERVAALRDYLRDGLHRLNHIAINSPGDASPYIFNFSMPGYKSEPVLHYLDEFGICISSGSACSKGIASHTLAAMNVSREIADSAIRVGFCGANTQSEVDALLNALESAQKNLKQYRM